MEREGIASVKILNYPLVQVHYLFFKRGRPLRANWKLESLETKVRWNFATLNNHSP